MHPFYGDVRTAEAIAADVALEALVAGAEAPFLPLDGPDEGVTPSLGGRVDGALPEATPGAWDAPADIDDTPPLGDRVDAALDALAADPEPYTPQLGGRVDAALDALTTWEDSSASDWGHRVGRAGSAVARPGPLRLRVDGRAARGRGPR